MPIISLENIVALIVICLWALVVMFVLKKMRQNESDLRTTKRLVNFFNITRRPGEYRFIEVEDLNKQEEIMQIRNAAKSKCYSFGFMALFVFTLGIFMVVTGNVFPFKILSLISAPLLSLGALFSWLFVKIIDKQYKIVSVLE